MKIETDYLLTDEQIKSAKFQASCSDGYLPSSQFSLNLIITKIMEAERDLVLSHLDELAREAGYVKPPTISKKDFLRLPMDIRKLLLDWQVREMFAGIPDEQRIKEMHGMMD